MRYPMIPVDIAIYYIIQGSEAEPGISQAAAIRGMGTTNQGSLRPMKILFLHPNMPGQYKHLAAACGADPDNEVRFITHPGRPAIEGVKPITYPEKIPVQPDIAEPLAKAYLYKLYRCVTHSQQVRQRCLGLRREGFVPDIIVAHLGWGSGLFLKDVFPETPLLGYAEYFFTAERSEDSFLTGKPMNLHERERTRINNAQHLFSLTDADWCITPTRFQRDRHPALFHAKMSVLHDGIDTDAIAPDAQAGFTLPDGRRLTAADEVVTYISPVFEPHRGFPQFMAAVALIQQQRPHAHIVLVGMERGKGYGRNPSADQPSWQQKMISMHELDHQRLHLVGPLPHRRMVRVMQISTAHVYLTVPFVLSWSVLEAMAAGCLVVGSNTEPVREIIQHEHNGLLVDFFLPRL